MTLKGAPWRRWPARWGLVWKFLQNRCRFVLALLVGTAAWTGYAEARDLPLYYYNLALQARANYERALTTNRPDVVRAYYDYSLAAHDDYVRAYQAFYGRPGVRTVAARPDSNRVFASLLGDPGNVALNVRYAQLAEAEGAPRKALTAYQRALRLDPKNVAAQQGLDRVVALLGPDATKGILTRSKDQVDERQQAADAAGSETFMSLEGGFRYETSASGRPDIIPREDSFILNASGSLVDERTVGTITDFRLRTDFYVYADFYIDNDNSDYDLISLKVGPVFPISKEWQFVVMPFAEASFLDYKHFSHKGGVSAAFENLGDHWLNTVEVKLGREDFSSDFDGRDATQPEIAATLVAYDLINKKDHFFFTPTFAYNNAEESRFRYLQPGLSLQYESPIASSFILGMTLSYFARLYEGKEINVARNRRDANFLAAPTLTYKGFIFDSVDLIGRYSFEQNWSNDGAQNYDSHSVGLNVKWDY